MTEHAENAQAVPDPRIGLRFEGPLPEKLSDVFDVSAAKPMGKSPEELAEIREALGQLEQATALMETLTDADKLRWVLTFVETDLDHLTPEEQRARSYQLRALTPSRPTMPVAYLSVLGPMPMVDLKSLQAQIRQGLHALMLDPRPLDDLYDDPLAGWTLPAIGTRLFRRSAIDARNTVIVTWNYARDEHTKIIHAVADLVRLAGHCLRVCRQCRRLFVGRKRQTYCQPTCSQKARDRRRPRHTQPGVTPPPQR